MMEYNPADHYWIVAGDASRVWATAATAYVTVGDPAHIAWLAGGGHPTRIASEAELDDVLLAAGCGDRAPHPPKRQVLKSIIISRLIEAGKIGAAKAALESNAAYFARWWAPDRPAINFDDPDALFLLDAIGADAGAVLAE